MSDKAYNCMNCERRGCIATDDPTLAGRCSRELFRRNNPNDDILTAGQRWRLYQQKRIAEVEAIKAQILLEINDIRRQGEPNKAQFFLEAFRILEQTLEQDDEDEPQNGKRADMD